METNDTPSLYEDPNLIAASQGDENLLDRLVGLEGAKQMLAQDPDDETKKAVYDTMLSAVEDRRRQLRLAEYRRTGVPMPDEPPETGM